MDQRRYTPVPPVLPVGNRAQRRQAQRQASRVTTVKARLYGPITNAMEYVTLRATRMTDTERGNMLQPARDGFKALREGVATYQQWRYVASAICVALAIEEQGIVRGLQEHLTAADLALAAVRKRVQEGAKGSAWGRCTTLYFDEIDAIAEGIRLHSFQLQQLAVSELRKAVHKASLGVRALGGEVIPAPSKTLPQPTQEPLL